METKRKNFAPEFRAEVVIEALCGESSQAELCRTHHLSDVQLSKWKCRLLERSGFSLMCPLFLIRLICSRYLVGFGCDNIVGFHLFCVASDSKFIVFILQFHGLSSS